jgi:hypothetical protein
LREHALKALLDSNPAFNDLKPFDILSYWFDAHTFELPPQVFAALFEYLELGSSFFYERLQALVEGYRLKADWPL